MRRLFMFLFMLSGTLSGFSQFNYLPKCEGELVQHSHYTLCYNENYEQASWVAYELTRFEVTNKTIDRTDDFRSDPEVDTRSATLSDYKGSGYDRGHLAPAGDMGFSTDAMTESFYFSNMSPQDPSFNRGIWRKLETNVRNWAADNSSIYVVTGGIFNNIKGYIGPNQVAVPGSYYKVILDYQEPEVKAIAFVLPNEKGTNDLQHYAQSIDYVESITGLDFFPELEDGIEDRLESEYDITDWTFSSSRSYSSSSSSSSSKKVYYSDSKNKINVNTATAAQLDQLYGIGPAKAQAIINARPYRSVDDLIRAKGIGPKTLEGLRPYVKVK